MCFRFSPLDLRSNFQFSNSFLTKWCEKFAKLKLKWSYTVRTLFDTLLTFFSSFSVVKLIELRPFLKTKHTNCIQTWFPSRQFFLFLSFVYENSNLSIFSYRTGKQYVVKNTKTFNTKKKTRSIRKWWRSLQIQPTILTVL